MSNDLTKVIPQILAQGLLALRENCVMPRLVNSDYDVDAKKKGATIDVPIPSAVTATAVAPGVTAPANADSAPTSAVITLDQWYEAPFYLTDKELLESMEGTIPMQASEAVKSLANNVNSYIMAQYKGVYGFNGASGTTPFGTDTSEATAARKNLNTQLAPLGDRRFVIDPDAEANALDLRAFQDMSFSGSAAGIVEGQINRKLGFDWYMDQLVPTHTSTALTAGNATINGAHAAGVTSVSIAKATNSSPLVEGDIITFAGDSQTYVVGADVTLAVGNTAVAINPPLKVAASGGEAVTLKATHVVNLAFHRDAFAFASRPLEDTVAAGLGSIIQSAVDPVSGLSLRVEVTRQHKQIRWSYDILYGAELIRPELANRTAG